MVRGILSQIGKLILWSMRWYLNKVLISWNRELRKLRRRSNYWVWIGLCIFFALFLLPYLAKEVFADSFLLGLSFLWCAFLAISFAYVLKNPLVMIIIYVGVFFGREVMTIFSAAKEETTSGNIIGALIVFSLGVYLIIWANRMKKGDIE